MKIAAIGDVHGCNEELQELLGHLYNWFGDDQGRIIFLGDMIDRGPNSREVMDTIIGWDDDRIAVTALCGNHDYMMIETLLYGNTKQEKLWLSLDSGGEETLASMGQYSKDYAIWMKQNLLISYRTNNHLFVHAGINPSRSLDEQRTRDMMMIRNKFLYNVEPYENDIKVVHGHTPTIDDLVELMPNRIGVDTGCVFGGNLSAALFKNDIYVGSLNVGSKWLDYSE